MKPRTPYPLGVVRVAAFLKRREPWLRATPREQLLRFINWYWCDARVGVVRKAGRVVAVALARATNDIERTELCAYHHDESGRVVWIDHIASSVPEGIPVLLMQAVQRFGPREAYGGNVFKRDGERRMLPQRIVERLSQTGDHHNGFTFHPCTTCAA